MEQRRRRAPRLSELRLDAVVARAGRLDKNGFPRVTLYDEDAQKVVAATLASLDEEGCDVPFGLEFERLAAPSFLGGGVESLDLSVGLTPERARRVEAFEARIKTLALQCFEAWFGRPTTAEEVDEMFVSCVRRPPPGKAFAPTLKAGVVLSAPPEQEAALTDLVVLRSGQTLRGRGWAWAQPTAEAADYWRRASAWPTLEFRSLWFNAKAFGLRIYYKELVLREAPSSRGHVAAFSDEVVARLL